MKSRTYQRCKGPLVSVRERAPFVPVAPVIMTNPVAVRRESIHPMPPPLEYLPRIKKEPSIAKPIPQATERGYCYG